MSLISPGTVSKWERVISIEAADTKPECPLVRTETYGTHCGITVCWGVGVGYGGGGLVKRKKAGNSFREQKWLWGMNWCWKLASPGPTTIMVSHRLLPCGQSRHVGSREGLW